MNNILAALLAFDTTQPPFEPGDDRLDRRIFSLPAAWRPAARYDPSGGKANLYARLEPSGGGG
ncbi:hypothetical protein LN650_18110 [Klebsiella pneumoniae subsp. pneumoniae]|nr:hypothetical protein [Klebsiella pneumoniae subsp. pneumoniae]